MTKIKLCGLRRPCDIEYANALEPEYVGFVFAESSRRYVEPEKAKKLRMLLKPGILPVGVFVNGKTKVIAELIRQGTVGAVQLHGHETPEEIEKLKSMIGCPIIQAFRIREPADAAAAEASPADLILLDSGGGTGTAFDWSLIQGIRRSYFLAGGLTPENVPAAIELLHPFAVDASSSLETDGCKDQKKMTMFVNAVRQRKD